MRKLTSEKWKNSLSAKKTSFIGSAPAGAHLTQECSTYFFENIRDIV